MDELEKERFKIDLELRSLSENIKAGSIKAEDARKKLDELRAKRADLMKRIALAAAPKNAASNTADVAQAMKERRAITLNGTGAINQIKELVKELQAKTPILERVRYFYGPNAATNIPILSPGLALPAAAAEGVTNVASDTKAVMGSMTLTPHAYVSVLPVSAEALTLGTVNFDAELPAIFADAFAQAFHNGILTGAGTGLLFKGLFASIPAANKIECAAAGAPTIADLVNLALEIQDKTDEGVIIMRSSTYAAILADATAGVADLYKEELIRMKTIEGVRVILTSAAPGVTTAGSVMAVAGRLTDYAFGLASEISIKPLEKVGDTNTYFQAVMFANGAPILDKNFYGLVAVAAVG
jgi:HK97 family phage major capsid protein